MTTVLYPYAHILKPKKGGVFRLDLMCAPDLSTPRAEIVHDGVTYQYQKMICFMGEEVPFYEETTALNVYTFGYFPVPASSICDWVRDHDALLVDIRFLPRSSHFPHYNMEFLQKALGENYYWLGDWGNSAYAMRGRIELADWEGGLKRLAEIKSSGWRTVVLMCACGNLHTCHRKVVADRLRGLGYTVEELSL